MVLADWRAYSFRRNACAGRLCGRNKYGALVGGAYAAGVSPDHMGKKIVETDINTLFDDDPPRSRIAQTIKRDDFMPLFDFSLGFNSWKIQMPSGASAGYKFELFLKELIDPPFF
jgi:NTE family protein